MKPVAIFVKELPGSGEKFQKGLEMVGMKGILCEYGKIEPLRTAEDCSALILVGGGDVDPSFYGEENTASRGIDIDYDRACFSVLDAFSKVKKPVLGVCRGHQLINVFFGGSLYQDIPGHGRKDTDPHKALLLKENSELMVNSTHHQAVKKPGAGFEIMAKAPDGTVECIYNAERRILGVQWHPERLIPGEDALSLERIEKGEDPGTIPENPAGLPVFRAFKKMIEMYQNPLPITGIGDPFVLRASDGMYYMYATSADDGFKCWKSADIIHWEDCGYCYRADETCWGLKCFWAPECYEIDGKYWLFYSADDRVNPTDELENFCLGLAVSKSPEGPFTDCTGGRPLLKTDYPVIDADLLRDDTGAPVKDENGLYTIYYSRCCYKHQVGPYEESHIYGAKLDLSAAKFVGEPKLLLQPDQEWEGWSAPTTGRRWAEGPLTLLHNGKVYMMYSANFYAEKYYAIGYAVADEPLGTFVKYEKNPVMMHDYPRVSGPGHNSVCWSPDGKEMFIVYHIHTHTDKGGMNRQVCIDRMGFLPDGTIYCDGPTTTPQPMPSGTL